MIIEHGTKRTLRLEHLPSDAVIRVWLDPTRVLVITAQEERGVEVQAFHVDERHLNSASPLHLTTVGASAIVLT